MDDGIDMDMVYTNLTFMDEIDEPFEPYEAELIEKIYYFITDYCLSLLHIFALIHIIASISIFFFVMYKFKSVRTNTNMYLASFFMSLLAYSVCWVINISLSTFGEFMLTYYLTFIYIFFFDAAVILSTVMSMDWFLLATYKKSFLNKNVKGVIAGVYMLCSVNLLGMFFTHTYYAMAWDSVCNFKVVVLSVLCLIVQTSLNIAKGKKEYSEEELRTLYALKLPFYYLLFWVPFLVSIFLLILASLTRTLVPIIVYLMIVCYVMEFVGFISPIYLVYVLGKMDRNFQMGYDYVFKSSVRNYVGSNEPHNLMVSEDV